MHDLVEQAIKLIDPSQGSPMADNIVTGSAGSKPLAYKFGESNALCFVPDIAIKWFSLAERTTVPSRVDLGQMLVELNNAVFKEVLFHHSLKSDDAESVRRIIVVSIVTDRVNEKTLNSKYFGELIEIDGRNFRGNKKWARIRKTISLILNGWHHEVLLAVSDFNERKKKSQAFDYRFQK